MVKIEALSKSFGKTHVLRSVDAQFDQGQCIALIGPNGCGKTTLIKCILGMVIPEKGNIICQGMEVKSGFKYREKIGYMPQIGHYPENMSIRQVMDMIIGIRKKKKEELDLDLYHAFQLSGMESKKMSALSGGTTQKVSATLAFLFNPDILILDEPTAGLDPLASEILKNKIIQEKQRGKLILITSHLLSELDDLVSQIIFMQEGQILFHKSTEQLVQDTHTHSLSQAIINVLKTIQHG